MFATVAVDFSFEASHRLEHLGEDHPCFPLHGHSYHVTLEVGDRVDEKTGFVIDYADISKLAQPVLSKLDHTHLNDVEGLRFSTTEHIARWIWDRLKPAMPALHKIIISETPQTRCVYEGK